MSSGPSHRYGVPRRACVREARLSTIRYMVSVPSARLSKQILRNELKD
jgi:hypothetical protein